MHCNSRLGNVADGEAGKAVCAAAQLPTAVQWCGSARGGDSACVAQCLAAAQSCAAASSAAGRGGPDATAAHTTCCSQVRTAAKGCGGPVERRRCTACRASSSVGLQVARTPGTAGLHKRYSRVCMPALAAHISP